MRAGTVRDCDNGNVPAVFWPENRGDLLAPKRGCRPVRGAVRSYPRNGEFWKSVGSESKERGRHAAGPKPAVRAEGSAKSGFG